MFTMERWLASVAEHFLEGQSKTKRQLLMFAEDQKTARLTWEQEEIANFAGKLEMIVYFAAHIFIQTQVANVFCFALKGAKLL